MADPRPRKRRRIGKKSSEHINSSPSFATSADAPAVVRSDNLPSFDTGILDLPNEMILMAATSMELEDMRSIALVNRRLYYLLFPLYLELDGILDGYGHIAVTGKTSFEALESLRQALWLSGSHIPRLQINGHKHGLVNKARFLDVARLCHGKHVISTLDIFLAIGADQDLMQKSRSRDRVELCEGISAVTKGVDVACCSTFSVGSFLLSKLETLLVVPNMKAPRSTRSTPRFRYLQHLSISTALMFTATLYNRTLLMLNSPSVTTLNLAVCLSSSSWSQVLRSITIPHLKTLELKGGGRLPFDDLTRFTARHRNLLDLSIQDTTTGPWNPCAGSLCHVRSITSPPGFISHAIRNCGLPQRHLQLQLVMPHSSYLAFEALDHDFEALSTLDDCDVYLSLRLSSWLKPSDPEWLRYATVGGPSADHQRPERLVTCIKTLKIDFSIFYRNTPVPETAKWLELFPCLHQVQVSMPFMHRKTEEEKTALKNSMCEALLELGDGIDITVI